MRGRTVADGRSVVLQRVGALAIGIVVCACGGDAPSSTATALAAGVQRQQTPGTVAAVDAQVTSTVEQVLASGRLPAIHWSSVTDVAPLLRPIYEQEPDRLVWFNGVTPVPALSSTLAGLKTAADHGLDPVDYDADSLPGRLAGLPSPQASSADRANFDLAVSVAVVRMLKAVHLGRVDPTSMGWGYEMAAKPFDVTVSLDEVRRGKPLAGVLDGLEPPFAHYARGRKMLAIYRARAQAGEPAAVPTLPKGQTKVTSGQTWAGVPPLATRLRTFGDLSAGALVDGSVYGAPLVAAVRTFQERHGLDADGVIGAATIKALNVSLAQRVRQLELAMERERWLPNLDGHPNVFLNVPLFRLWGDDPSRSEEPLRMNVVVGKALNHKTPIFVEQMEYVIFRPYWNPPPSIMRSEILPKARRDSGYLARESMEIVASGADDARALPETPENLAAVAAGALTIRQKPGPTNSLGLAKFIFPNDDNVYMHGTPATQLFARARRDFSHGCIRLEDPARFAEWVLRDQPEWDRARIDRAMQSDRPTRVNLKDKLTVVVFYDTVHVNSESVAYFVDDIYGHDKLLDAALRKGYPYPVKR